MVTTMLRVVLVVAMVMATVACDGKNPIIGPSPAVEPPATIFKVEVYAGHLCQVCTDPVPPKIEMVNGCYPVSPGVETSVAITISRFETPNRRISGTVRSTFPSSTKTVDQPNSSRALDPVVFGFYKPTDQTNGTVSVDLTETGEGLEQPNRMVREVPIC